MGMLDDAVASASVPPEVGGVLLAVADALTDALAKTAAHDMLYVSNPTPAGSVPDVSPMTRLQSTLLSTAEVLALTLDHVSGNDGDEAKARTAHHVARMHAEKIELDGVRAAIANLASACAACQESLCEPGAGDTLEALEGVVPSLVHECSNVSHAVETAIGHLTALGTL